VSAPHPEHRLLATIAAEHIARASGVVRHDIALTLGSGWSHVAESLGETLAVMPAEDVPGFRKPVLDGHSGEIRSVRLSSGKHLLVIGARTHLYEGHGVAAVAHGVRVAATAGVSTMILTNASGSLRREWPPGTPVLIRDHINLTGQSPLEGATFIDMSEAYSSKLRDLAREVKPEIPEGVYVQFRGPQYETPAEVKMAGILGGDLVGMSTALETIAAREAGLNVLGISLSTNLAAGVSPEPLSHDEVVVAGKAALPTLVELLRGVLDRL
jgi:purine-nucleoside phosphorylase